MRSRFAAWLAGLLLMSLPVPVLGQPPAMVVDLNSVIDPSPSASPEPIVRFGTRLIFLACDATDGCEPWVTDGTAPGTLQLADANPTGSSAFAATIEGRAIETPAYAAFMLCTGGGLSDCEPWRSDGTPAGTFRLKDIRTGTGSSNPGYFAFAGGILYFAADDGLQGAELWRSNGTIAGTVLVEDIRPGAIGSDPRHLTALGSIVVFQADNPGSEIGLWRSDGTAPGTLFYSDIDIIGTESVGAADPIGPFAAELGGEVYFSGQESAFGGNQLFATDGTLGGTALVKDLSGSTGAGAPNGFRKLGSKLLFTAFNQFLGGTGVELWATDGTGPGTVEISALIPGGNPSNPVSEPTVAGGLVYFRNDFDGELWKSDGTAVGTVIVEANGPIAPRGLAAAGSQVCFTAQTAGEGVELWKSDGSPVGTGPVVDLLPGSGDGATEGPAAGLGSLCLFAGNDGLSGIELWKSDLTPGDATPVGEIAQVTAPSSPRNFVAMGEQLYFSADDAVGGRELFTSDATPGGTQQVVDLRPGPTGSDPTEILLLGSQLVFAADDGAAGREVFRSNGTAPGTAVYAEVGAGGAGSDPSGLTLLGADLFFAADDATTGRELWRRTPSALTLVANLVDPGSSNPRQLTPFLGEIFFLGDDAGGNLELWRTNGTGPGTSLVADLTALSGFAEHGELAVAAERLLVVLADTANQTGAVWSSDGTPGGTSELVALALGFDNFLPADFVTQGPRFLFRAFNENKGAVDVWTSDGTPGGTLPLDVATAAAQAGTLAVHAGRAYFDGLNDNADTALWRSDGTLGGSIQILPPQIPQWPMFQVLSSAFSRLFFTPGLGEPWTSNATAVGTVPLGAPLAQEAGVDSGYVAAGKHLYFSANDTIHGVELWAFLSPSIFADGFEVSNLSNWSAAAP